ncbi:MAG: Iron-sulfur flavoprotein [Deltaproteobacteria bacterium]|jgi:multimeric flavodoxin WrbA|nr:Iron-sulfur flavoprotein [Deltaproteobacteria bacterium]
MKILGIVGSPRKGGNTEVLLEQVLAAAKDLGADVEQLFIADKKIAPCDGCESCLVTGKCKIKDDMQEMYSKLIEADGIVFGTPVYFWGMTAQAKAFIDRTFVFRPDRPLRNKIAGFVIVARRRGVSETLSALVSYCFMQKMHAVGGVTAYADEKGGVRQNKAAMDEARELAGDMVHAIQQSAKIK